MMKSIILASALGLCIAVPARANDIQRSHEMTKPLHTALPAEVVEVEHSGRRSVGAVVAGDAIGGAIAGAAVGGGVAIFNRYGTNGGNGDWGDWQRDLLVGAGIGLAVGLVFGAIDASANAADRVPMTPLADKRASGFEPAMGQYGVRF